ncbi:hypothetical protein EQW76_02415 [Rhizobium sp. rho-13.1]|nr:hypothetical protein EQW76_02415 [Rhizobium sp. rho-13.1]TQY18887.1 hypothetical protein EQW74_04010 [Rhizobium sp. rho-1.1]
MPCIVRHVQYPRRSRRTCRCARSCTKILCLEHFCRSSIHRSALSLCFYAFPDVKPLRTFAGTALRSARDEPG